MAHDIFIGHATRDQTAAEAACQALESAGLRCWIAPRDAPNGIDWSGADLAAIKSAKAFVLIFSSAANGKPHLALQVARAIDYDVPIIPVRIEPVETEAGLEDLLPAPDWLEASTGPFASHLGALVALTRRAVARKARPPSPDQPVLLSSRSTLLPYWAPPPLLIVLVGGIAFLLAMAMLWSMNSMGGGVGR